MIEAGIGVAAVLAWLVAVFIVIYRGYILPAVRTDDFKFEVAERRGLLDGHADAEPATALEDGPRPSADAAVAARAAASGQERRYAVWKAWREDPSFKAEVRRRYRDHYPRYHAEIALLIGGVWSLVFVVAEPLRRTLVPESLDVLYPVYVLVAPLWIAVAVMALLEGLKSARGRSRKRLH